MSRGPMRVALIHALAHSVAPINEAMARDWPEAVRMNLLDDSLSADLAANGRGLDAVMHDRFARLAQYALDCGSNAILFTCSAFGPCIDAVAKEHDPLPVLKPNEAMVAEAVKAGAKIGLVSSFAPTLASMPAEFPAGSRPVTRLAEGAMDALDRGDVLLHDRLVAEAAHALKAEGCGVIALAQFSMARARPAVEVACGLPVLTTVDSAV
ncbi:MAG: aspartate/glutamate racemase family protein, partial [Burkholderiaceae bacterium]